MAVGVAAPAMAQQVAFKSGEDRLDALINDISAGRRAAAVAHISSIESMSGKRTLATTPSQFVDRLLGCRPDGKAEDIGFEHTKLIKVIWSCPGARYLTVFDPQYAAPYITVGEFEDEAVRKARLALPLAPPAPPLLAPPLLAPTRTAEPQMSDTDRAALISTALSTLVSGDFDRARPIVAPNARITFGRRDPVAKVTVVELDGTGADAFVEQGRSAIVKLGKPISVDCDPNSCHFAFEKKDRILIAIVGAHGSKITYVQFLYVIRTGAP